MKPKTIEEDETIHAILAGLLLNGIIMGETGQKINENTLDFAKEQLAKHLAKREKKALSEERQKLEDYKQSHQLDYFQVNDMIEKAIEEERQRLLNQPESIKEEKQKAEEALRKEKNLNQVSFYEGYIKGLKFNNQEVIATYKRDLEKKVKEAQQEGNIYWNEMPAITLYRLEDILDFDK